MSAIDATLKKPFTASEKLAKDTALFDENYNAQQHALLDEAVMHATQAVHESKDVSLKTTLLDTYHTYVYSDMLLLRKNTVFLGFANRYHKNHARYAKDARDKLIDLKRYDTALFKDFVTLMQKKAEYYNGLIKTNGKTINTQKSQVSEFRSSQWDIVKVQKLFEKEHELVSVKE